MPFRALYGLEELHDSMPSLPAFCCRLIEDLTVPKSLGLHFEVDSSVDVRGVDRHVPEPRTYRVDVHARLQKMTGRGMADRMRADLLHQQGWHGFRGLRRIPLYHGEDSKAGNGLFAAIQEDTPRSRTSVNERCEYLDGEWPEGASAYLAPLASNTRPGRRVIQTQVVYRKMCDLVCTCTGVIHEEHQGVVAAALRCPTIWRIQQW